MDCKIVKKILGSRCVLGNRYDGIMCQHHVNQLKNNREVSDEMIKNVKKRGRVFNNTMIVTGMKALIETCFLRTM